VVIIPRLKKTGTQNRSRVGLGAERAPPLLVEGTAAVEGPPVPVRTATVAGEEDLKEVDEPP